MTAKTKTRVKATKTRVKAGRANAITDREIKVATKLAKRKTGCTRKQVAERLKVSEARATTILKRVKGAKTRPAGASAGKACRALIFKV